MKTPVQIFSVPFHAMGSNCECRIPAASRNQAEKLAEIAIAEVRRIETKYSRYRSDSILSKINQQAGKQAVKIDKETSELLDYAEVLYQSSLGLFDISSGILRRAWDFKSTALPNPLYLESLLKKVGWNKIERTKESVFLTEAEMEIDFGGFGKEYAVDRAATLLLNQGVQSGLVDLGGDLRILGPQLNGDAWQIGIQNPRDGDKVSATIPITSGALATSGDYERYIEIDGQRYCHILDPRTGYPVQHWQSVSVLASLSIAAGSYATITMLMQAKGETWLADAGVAYFLIDSEGKLCRKDVA